MATQGLIALEQRLVLVLVAVALLTFTFELIRKRRLREEYAVLWVCTGLMVMVFALFPRILFLLAGWLHLDHAILLTFLLGLFLAAILLHYSVVISKHANLSKGLAQDLALLKDEIERLRSELEAERRKNAPATGDDSPPGDT